MLQIIIKRNRLITSFNGHTIIEHFKNYLDALCHAYVVATKYNRIEFYIDNQIKDN